MKRVRFNRFDSDGRFMSLLTKMTDFICSALGINDISGILDSAEDYDQLDIANYSPPERMTMIRIDGINWLVRENEVRVL